MSVIIEDEYLRSYVELPRKHSQSGTPWPVLVFLHGDKQDELNEPDLRQAVTTFGPLRKGSSLAARRFIVVCPQIKGRGGNRWHEFAEPVRRLVRKVVRRFNGDGRRTYLTGFSFGANGVFELASRQRRTWAKLWPVDPPNPPMRDRGLPTWLWYGQKFRATNESARRGLTLTLTKATTSPRSQRISTRLRRDHVPTAVEAYRSGRPYEWLLAEPRARGNARRQNQAQGESRGGGTASKERSQTATRLTAPA